MNGIKNCFYADGDNKSTKNTLILREREGKTVVEGQEIVTRTSKIFPNHNHLLVLFTPLGRPLIDITIWVAKRICQSDVIKIGLLRPMSDLMKMNLQK